MSDAINTLRDIARPLVDTLLLGNGGSAATVAAALRTRAGRVYTGVSVDLSCGIGFCAEHAAVAEMLKNRETEIAAIVAVGPNGVLAPCGRCRELLLLVDARNGDTEVGLPGGRIGRVRDLLPDHWMK